MMKAYLLVALGSAVGGVLRFGMVRWMDGRWPSSLPLGTILVNITGSFLIGVFAGYRGETGQSGLSEAARNLLMVGLLGGYTTFSAFSLQSWELLRNGHPMLACLNVLLSVALCIGGVAAGVFAIKAW